MVRSCHQRTVNAKQFTGVMMNEEYGQLVMVAGNLFSRIQELNALLNQMVAEGHYQGELRLTHRSADGQDTDLYIHIDGTDFTMMPGGQVETFRLDVSGLSARLE